MNGHAWIERIMRTGVAIVLGIVLIPVAKPAGATAQALGAITDQSQSKQPQQPTLPTIAGDEKWSSQFVLGADDVIFAAVSAPNGDLYVGGDFHNIAGIGASHVAQWSASSNRWSALGSGVDGRVNALAFSGNTLYLAGSFTTAGGGAANGIASWNAVSGVWSNMGGGLAHAGTAPSGRALTIDGSGNLYLAGTFDSVSGVSAQNVAKWNGSTWSALGSGVGTTNDYVAALAVSGMDVYAGGSFASPANIAHFNGTSWSGVGSGVNNTVLALAISGSNLCVGGTFSEAYDGSGTHTVNQIALWNIPGNSWSAMGNGTGGGGRIVYALAIDSGGNIYAAGEFQGASAPGSNVAMWNGSSWEKLQTGFLSTDGMDNTGYALAIHADDVYVGGVFLNAGGWSALHLARWNSTDKQWYSPGNSVNGNVYAVAIDGYDLYLGGNFSSAGGLTAHSLARWNALTGTWFAGDLSNLSGCNGSTCPGPEVTTIAINGSAVYVGGNFTTAGGKLVNNVARWDSVLHTWSAMGGGVTVCSTSFCSAVVYKLVADGAGVDVGGLFTNAGTTVVNNIAYWNGSAWFAFTDGSTTGTNGTVFAIALDSGGAYYFGGQFSSPYQNLTYFDGASFFAGGHSAPNAAVRTIVVQGNVIYIGGDFTNAAGSGANYIAKASGAGDWTPLGSSVNDKVFTLALRGNTLFVGGFFTQSGALGINRVAAWDTSQNTWSNLGSGADNNVIALAVDPNFINVGGFFANAGLKPAQGFSRWGAYPVFVPVIEKN